MTNAIVIYSHFADCPEWRIERHFAGLSEMPTWSGEVESTDLEDIFRAFNRVDEADCKRLEALGYTLPSLSMGDVVCREEEGGLKLYLCAPVGWKEVSLTWMLDYQRLPIEEKFLAMRKSDEAIR